MGRSGEAREGGSEGEREVQVNEGGRCSRITVIANVHVAVAYLRPREAVSLPIGFGRPPLLPCQATSIMR